MSARCWLGFPFLVALLLLSATTSKADEDGAGPLKGEWVAIAGMHNGKKLSKEQLSGFRLSLAGLVKERQPAGSVTLSPPMIPADAITHGGYTTLFPVPGYACYLVPKTSPKQISFLRSNGFKATTYPGIYDLKDDTLTVCFNLEPWFSPDGPALRAVPKEFASPNKSGLTLLTLKKLKK